jgi:hypothetical protein
MNTKLSKQEKEEGWKTNWVAVYSEVDTKKLIDDEAKIYDTWHNRVYADREDAYIELSKLELPKSKRVALEYAKHSGWVDVIEELQLDTVNLPEWQKDMSIDDMSAWLSACYGDAKLVEFETEEQLKRIKEAYNAN